MARRGKSNRAFARQMILCDVCGNDIAAGSAVCPFCDSRQKVMTVSGRDAHAPRIKDLNLKHDMPTGEQALERLDAGIAAAKMAGTRILRVVHGYGSSGRGGVIKELVRQHLTSGCAQGRVECFVPGEAFTVSHQDGERLLRIEPQLRRSLHRDRCNPGITFVKL